MSTFLINNFQKVVRDADVVANESNLPGCRSFGKYFSQGKHIYDFAVTVPTTIAMLGELFGASQGN